jgi:hypothetical protein
MLRALIRTYGVRGLQRRAIHELRRKLGWFKRMPSPNVRSGGGEHAPAYCSNGDWLNIAPEELAQIKARGRRVVDGWYQAYGHEWRRLPDAAEGWRRHPLTGFEFQMVDWWLVPMSPSGGDIKDIWEPGRFSWVYDLVRAYAATGDRIYANTFHEWLARWQAANPPFRGPHWACGQEVAIRVLAILHAEQGLPTPLDDPHAAERIVTVLAWSGERIADAIGYGLSQRNNHGISETAGLIHLGLRLRDTHTDARRWLTLGTRLLEDQICDQFSPDGWYAQHSFTYMRVALEQALYAHRALSMTGTGLSPKALARLDAAVSLLSWLIDGPTGEVPNHGANDGARVLPLSMAAYRDFRPLLSLAAIIRGIPLPADVPHDPEVPRWLGGQVPRSAPARGDGATAGDSGWAAARVCGWIVFLRAGEYRHRPSHLDSLHVDIRFDGKEIIADAGTFAYNAPAPWNNGLVSALVHNGPIVDEREPAERGPHFLWLSWPRARMVAVEHSPGCARLVAERPGAVRREIAITRDAVRIDDRVLDRGVRSLQITWLLHPDVKYNAVMASGHSQRIEAREGDVIGWFSSTYGLRLPSAAIRVHRWLEVGAEGIETTIVPPPAPFASSVSW